LARPPIHTAPLKPAPPVTTSVPVVVELAAVPAVSVVAPLAASVVKAPVPRVVAPIDVASMAPKVCVADQVCARPSSGTVPVASGRV
jgi:hypothetical protein